MAQLDLSAWDAQLPGLAQKLPDLDGLDQADIQRLEALILQAQAQQAASLAAATEESLSHVPALLRGAVRKLLFR